MKRRISKFLTAALCIVLLVAALAVYAAADDSAVPTVVYLDGTNGSDDNNGSAADKAVATLKKAYEVLLAAEGGVKDRADAEGVIVVCGTTTQSSDFANTAATALEHKGTVTYTSIYNNVNYAETKGAKMIFATTGSSELRIQMGGPTVYSKVTISALGTKKSVTIYTAAALTVEQDAVVEATLGTEKFFIRGGYAYKTTSDSIAVTLNTGTYSFVAPSNAESASAGIYSVTVGGTAKVDRLIGGETNKSGAGTNGSATITVNEGAAVTNLYVCGDYGVIADATVVLNGGTVGTLASRREGKSGTANNITVCLVGNEALPGNTIAAMGSANFKGTRTLVLKDRTSASETVDSIWDVVQVTGSSTVTMAAAMPVDTALVVDAGSTVTLVAADDHTYTGEGTVIYTHEHKWVEDTTKRVAGSCTSEGSVSYYCDIASCSASKTESTGFEHDIIDGVCSKCGSRDDVVYVKDGGTGDGRTADTAVGNLEAAYEALLSRTNIKDNSKANGTIVICGKLTISQHFNYYSEITHAGTVTYTGSYGGTDYDGVLLIYAASKDALTPKDEHRFQLGGPTVMENLTLDRGSGSAGASLTIYAGTSLVMAETVKVVNTNWVGTYAEPVAGLTDEQINTMKLSAHRGYQPMGPENSILSFTAAGELGFDYIETDVYMTKDGVLVCVHDSTLKRTTNDDSGTSVMDMTYEEILKYKIDTASYGYDITQADQNKLYVPTFREYLEICKKYGCKPFIEIKDYREDTLKAIINMALEYFPAEDIVMSCISIEPLQTSYSINPNLFHHLIWGADQSDAGYTRSIGILSQMKNSEGKVYAGIAFNITNLHLEENYNTAKGWIEKANAVGLQTCLRGADDMTQVRLMFELGIDYYPTNKTTPAMLEQLKTGVKGGWNFGSASGGKIFIRGGSRTGTTAEDVSITLLGGIYDFVAPSNAEAESTGSYSITVGGNAFVSRLIAGETYGKATGDRVSSVVTIQNEATVKNLYLAGDAVNTQNVTVNILGGTVSAMEENRGTNGKAENVTVNIASVDLLPATVSISKNTVITGSKVLMIGGTGSLGDAAAWDKLVANDGALITLTGTYPENLEKVGSGKFCIYDQSFAFETVGTIKEDGKGVALGSDIPYTLNGSGELRVVWYTDQGGQKGKALTDAPAEAGTYWVGVSVAETANANGALCHGAVEEQLIRFTISHVLEKVEALASTCTGEGNVAHYHCSVCGRNFKDAEGAQEIADVTDPAAGHALTRVEAKEPTATEDGNIAYYVCAECGKLYADTEGKTEIALVDTVLKATGNDTSDDAGSNTGDTSGNTGDVSSNTGDDTIVMPFVLLMILSAAGISVLTLEKRKMI